MARWLLFALLAVGFTVIYEVFTKKALTTEDDHDPVAYASSLFAVVAGVSFIAYLFSGVHASDFNALLNPQLLLILPINLLMYSIAPSLYWRALKKLPASEVAILYDLTSFYIFIFGITLGTEKFQLVRLLGGIFIVGSAIILGVKTQWAGKFRVNKYFLMMMVATVLYAFAALTDNAIISKHYLSPLFFQVLNFGVPAGLILLLNPKSRSHLHKVYNPRVFKFTAVYGLLFFGSFWAIFQAYAAGGDTSEVNFVLASGTIAMVLAAALFLNERKYLVLKVICAVLTFVGIYLLH